jgi:hypothetical protein
MGLSLERQFVRCRHGCCSLTRCQTRRHESVPTPSSYIFRGSPDLPRPHFSPLRLLYQYESISQWCGVAPAASELTKRESVTRIHFVFTITPSPFPRLCDPNHASIWPLHLPRGIYAPPARGMHFPTLLRIATQLEKKFEAEKMALQPLAVHYGNLVLVLLRVSNPASIRRLRTALEHANHDVEQGLMGELAMILWFCESRPAT